MAKVQSAAPETATATPEVDVKALAAAERVADIEAIARAIPASCSEDMNYHELKARCYGRLEEWGATDAEVAKVMPIISEACRARADAVAKARAEAAARKAGRLAAGLEQAFHRG